MKFASTVVVCLVAGATYLFTTAGKLESQQTPPQIQRFPNGAPVAQVTGRVQINFDQTVDLFGYFTVMDGINAPLFSGDPSEKTAYFTYRADRVGARILRNGSLLHSLERPLAGNSTPLHIYYNPNPSNRDFSDPETFNQGTLIARFQSRAAAVDVFPGTYYATSGLVLESSTPFTAGGNRYDFRNLANGLSIALTGPAPSIESIGQALVTSGKIQIEQGGTGYAVSTVQ